MKTPPIDSRRCFVSAIRTRMDNQQWLRIVDEAGWEWAYIPYAPAEHNRCYDDARKCAAALTTTPTPTTPTNPNPELEMMTMTHDYESEVEVEQEAREEQAGQVETYLEEAESAEASLVEHEVEDLPEVVSKEEVAVAVEADKRFEYVKGLRAVADFFELHPEVELPWDASYCHFNIFHQNKVQLMAAARAMGNSEKIYQSEDFQLIKIFSKGVAVKVWSKRSEVCEAKVIGREFVPEKIIPAQPERVEPSYTKDVVEWECKALLSPEEGKEA